jgi:hypothetical protein
MEEDLERIVIKFGERFWKQFQLGLWFIHFQLRSRRRPRLWRFICRRNETIFYGEVCMLRFVVLAAVIMKCTVFGDVTLCSRTEAHWSFGETSVNIYLTTLHSIP